MMLTRWTELLDASCAMFGQGGEALRRFGRSDDQNTRVEKEDFSFSFFAFPELRGATTTTTTTR
jgi:hypothetical protein